ncbi:hypothetical protein JCM11251_007797 [Rhodosporidiobolus azoricus]
MSNPSAPTASTAASRGPLPPYLISNTPPTPSRSPSNASASGNDADPAEDEEESADESDFPEGDDADPDASTLSLSHLSPAMATRKLSGAVGSPWPYNQGARGGDSLHALLSGDEDEGDEEGQPYIPASSLPHEILLHILRLLPSSSLAPALRVCKSWCQCGVELLWHKPIFKTLPSLYRMLQVVSLPEDQQTFPYPKFVRRLNFNNLHHEMSDRMLAKLLPCTRIERLTLTLCKGLTSAAMVSLLSLSKRLIALDLSDVENVDDAVLEAMARNCPKLQGLNMSGCARITDRGLEQLALGCPALRRIKLRKCENITDVPIILLSLHCPLLLEVDLASCTAITSLSVMQLLRTSRALRELSLPGCIALTDEGFPDAETLVLASPGSGETAYLPPVVVFREDGSSIYLIPSSDALPNGSSTSSTAPHSSGIDLSTKLLTTSGHLLPLPTPLRGPPALRPYDHLRYLDVTSCAALTDAAVSGIVKYAPRLRNLILAKCTRLTDESLYAICGVGKHLHYLHLGHVSSITDRAVIAIARSCTRLRYIDLAYCNNLTDLSVTELAANLPRLKRIGLVRVTSITNASLQALQPRTSLERIHLSYCDNLSVAAVNEMLQSLPRLTHVSLTGVSAFRKKALQQFCRAPPRDLNDHQRRSFCVFSGRGVQDLRRFLRFLTPTELAALAHPDPIDAATDPAGAAFTAATAQGQAGILAQGGGAGGVAALNAQQLAQNQARLAQLQQARANIAAATARFQQHQLQQQALLQQQPPLQPQHQHQHHQRQHGGTQFRQLNRDLAAQAATPAAQTGQAGQVGGALGSPAQVPHLPQHATQHPHSSPGQFATAASQGPWLPPSMSHVQGQPPLLRAESAPVQLYGYGQAQALTNGNLLGLQQHGGAGPSYTASSAPGSVGGSASGSGMSARVQQLVNRLSRQRSGDQPPTSQQGDVNIPVDYVPGASSFASGSGSGSGSSFSSTAATTGSPLAPSLPTTTSPTGLSPAEEHLRSIYTSSSRTASSRMSAPPVVGAHANLRRDGAADGDDGEPRTPRTAAMDLDVEFDDQDHAPAGLTTRSGGRARGATVTRENFAAPANDEEEDGGSGSEEEDEGEEEDISMGES